MLSSPRTPRPFSDPTDVCLVSVFEHRPLPFEVGRRLRIQLWRQPLSFPQRGKLVSSQGLHKYLCIPSERDFRGTIPTGFSPLWPVGRAEPGEAAGRGGGPAGDRGAHRQPPQVPDAVQCHMPQRGVVPGLGARRHQHPALAPQAPSRAGRELTGGDWAKQPNSPTAIITGPQTNTATSQKTDGRSRNHKNRKFDCELFAIYYLQSSPL